MFIIEASSFLPKYPVADLLCLEHLSDIGHVEVGQSRCPLFPANNMTLLDHEDARMISAHLHFPRICPLCGQPTHCFQLMDGVTVGSPRPIGVHRTVASPNLSFGAVGSAVSNEGSSNYNLRTTIVFSAGLGTKQ